MSDTVALTYLIPKTTLWGRQLLFLDRQENWGMVRLNNVLRITQLVSGRAEIWILAVWLQKLSVFDYNLILNKYISAKLPQVSRESWNRHFAHLQLDYLLRKRVSSKTEPGFCPVMIDIKT